MYQLIKRFERLKSQYSDGLISENEFLIALDSHVRAAIDRRAVEARKLVNYLDFKGE